MAGNKSGMHGSVPNAGKPLLRHEAGGMEPQPQA